jgi:hypothetical protein
MFCNYDCFGGDRTVTVVTPDASASFVPPCGTVGGRMHFTASPPRHYVEFGLACPSDTVHGRFDFRKQRTLKETLSPKDRLEARLNELRINFRNPEGKIAKVIDSPFGQIPILAFVAYGAETVEASFFTSTGHEVTIDLDIDPSSGGQSATLANYLERIVKTIRINEQRAVPASSPKAANTP